MLPIPLALADPDRDVSGEMRPAGMPRVARRVATRGLRCLLLAAGLALGACASTAPRVEAQWADPSVNPGSATLRGAKVMVACDAFDLAVSQVCQDRLLAQVGMRGATPVAVAPDGRPMPGRPIDDQLNASAQAAGAQAILVVTATPTFDASGSGLSVGIGGFSVGSGGGGVGLGLSAPIGTGASGVALSARISDARTGRLLWTATVTGPAAQGNLDAQFDVLSGLLMQNAQAAGIF